MNLDLRVLNFHIQTICPYQHWCTPLLHPYATWTWLEASNMSKCQVNHSFFSNICIFSTKMHYSSIKTHTRISSVQCFYLRWGEVKKSNILLPLFLYGSCESWTFLKTSMSRIKSTWHQRKIALEQTSKKPITQQIIKNRTSEWLLRTNPLNSKWTCQILAGTGPNLRTHF